MAFLSNFLCRALALAGALLAFTPVSSAQDLGEGRYDIIILGGGKKAADARKSLEAFRKATFITGVLGGSLGGWPQAHESKDIPGLNPGFHIAVLGMCRHSEHSKDARSALLAAVRQHVPGAYVRSVKGAYGDPCPPIEVFAKPGDHEQKLQSAIRKSPKSAEALYAYAEFLAAPERMRALEARQVLDALLEVNPDNAKGRALSEKLNLLSTF